MYENFLYQCLLISFCTVCVLLAQTSGVVKVPATTLLFLSLALREILHSFEAEYGYKSAYALRGGYHTEDKTVGDKKFFTAGAGLLLFKNYGADFAYLIPVRKGDPMAHTMRISLSAYLGKN